MRLTDDRYAAERSQFELALRMIRHEARTRTIRECTGLSDDRIRKLYATYFRNTGSNHIRRRLFVHADRPHPTFSAQIRRRFCGLRDGVC